MANFDEKLCLQWNDFRENVSSAFGDLREDKEFTDVTLACEDGQQMEAHKVILATSSPFFDDILQRKAFPPPRVSVPRPSGHSWLPLLWQSKWLPRKLGFLPCNCWRVETKRTQWPKFQWCGWRTRKVHESKANPQNKRTIQNTHWPQQWFPKHLWRRRSFQGHCSHPQPIEWRHAGTGWEGVLIYSMMERNQNMIPNGKQANGKHMRATAFICKVCGKEDNHFEGMSIPCNYCDKIFGSRHSLSMHKGKFHK